MYLILVCLFERKWLDDGFMKGFLFCALAGMALKVGNEWKEHGWWIKVNATQKPVLWITSYMVVEGRYWSAVGKSFGEISTISPLGSDDVLVTVSAERLLHQRSGCRGGCCLRPYRGFVWREK
jgi:hypothetical protein